MQPLEIKHQYTDAPDVIDMLTALLKLAEPVYTTRCADGSEITHPTILAARAAIAKATGSGK